jgi:hypothetical protein
MLVEDLMSHVKSINIAIYNTSNDKNIETLVAEKEGVISKYCDQLTFLLKYKESKCHPPNM